MALNQSPVYASDFTTLCDNFPWACASEDVSYDDHLKLVKDINRHVNRSVNPISDLNQYGVQEFWALPTQLGGDCEDYALLKKLMLMESGVPSNNLLLSIVLNGEEPHAVLIYVRGSEKYILDNLTNRIIKVDNSKYRFLLIQNQQDPSDWVLATRK